MTVEFKDEDLALLKPYLKLIDIQEKTIANLHLQIEMIRYNQRYTNKKYRVPAKPTVYIPPEEVKGTKKK